MNKLPLWPLALLLGVLAAPAADYSLHPFKKLHLEKFYWSEGAAFGDLNRDGHPDAVSGPFWWEGPAFNRRHEIYPSTTTFKVKQADGTEQTLPGFEGGFGKKNAYSTDNFFAFTHDFNGDGWTDVLTYGLPNTPAYLYLNPQGKERHWERHTVLDHVDNESPTFTDLTGDGKPEIVCNYEGNFGYASPDWSNPTAKWKFTPITQKGNWQRYTHGLGAGDINGDGRLDVLFKDGWFEQPPSLAGAPVWKLHKVFFAPASAQMYAYDVNGDGRNDVITALAAHGYGLAWFEQLAAKDADGSPKWRSHVFMHKLPEENRHGVRFPELHAVELFDVDGDGLKDIITGNCYWAHGPAVAPGPGEEGVLYWFKLVRKADHTVDWAPHLIDPSSGVGRQIGTGDVNGDGRRDLVIGNKLGTFVFVHEAKTVSQETWEKAQPQVKFASAGDQQVESMSIVVHTMRPTGKPAVIQSPKAPGQAGGAPPPPAAAGEAKPPMVKGGVLPKGADGKPLNLDFEAGSLKDWKPTGAAWEGQPVKGPISANRPFGEGKIALHEGDYWIGGFEKKRDAPKGTLTSAPFKVTHPWAAFRIGGGAHPETRVELARADTSQVFLTAHGRNSETMLPVTVDLKDLQGKEMFIRIVDEHAGGWGHVNFDDFKFYAEKPNFPNAAGLARNAAPPPPPPAPLDDVKFDGLSAEAAAKAITLPPGFKAHVFAAEPDVKQPISFCIDDRGRLWVVEGYDYPQRKPEGQGTDRILVFEDTNGDHKFDKRTVFMEGLNFATGIEYGFGGVYVGAAPYLLFIPVKEGDEPKPAGKPQVLLEGWGYQDTHETLNSFQWGPDGWLYGCHGVFTHSHVKKPGDPDSTRQFINAGVWRYHPTKHIFEVFAEGTSNPWGIDFNEYGHCFIEACVIPHFWQMIQGARCQRQGGQHYAISPEETQRIVPDYFKQDFAGGKLEQPINPFIYDDLKAHGDHVHYLGDRPHAGNSRSASMGGGHAHAGLMVYLGGSWPDQYRGKVYMGNIHGQCINLDVPERQGSGYVGRHSPDFLNFNDRWSQVVNLRYDQDGSVYMIDWYDKQQCHRKEPEMHDRANGRIYKIVYGDTKVTKVDVRRLSDSDLMKLIMISDAWHARHARRVLQERAAEGILSAKEVTRLLGFVGGHLEMGQREPAAHLNLLWAGHVTGQLTESRLLKLATNRIDALREWSVQLLCEDKNPSEAALREFTRMAKEDHSPMVRLYLASAMQRTPVEKRLPILQALLARAEDANDHNLPLMYWYAAEPVVGASTPDAVKLLTACKIPKVREYITRRMTAAKPVAAAQ